MKIKVLTPVKAIRAKCLDCCGWQAKEVRLCTCPQCALWPYRMGKKPKDVVDGEIDVDDPREPYMPT